MSVCRETCCLFPQPPLLLLKMCRILIKTFLLKLIPPHHPHVFIAQPSSHKNVLGATLHRRDISHTQAASLSTDNAQARCVCTWAKHLTCPLLMVVIPDGRIGAFNPSLSISTFADNTHYHLQHVGFISIMPHRPIAPSLQTTHTVGEDTWGECGFCCCWPWCDALTDLTVLNLSLLASHTPVSSLLGWSGAAPNGISTFGRDFLTAVGLPSESHL